MTTYDAYINAIVNSRDDQPVFLAFADYLDDRGDAAANGMRVCAVRYWRPHTWYCEMTSEKSYSWNGGGRCKTMVTLPNWLFLRMPGLKSEYGCSTRYLTEQEAWQDFLAAWRQAEADGKVPWQLRQLAETQAAVTKLMANAKYQDGRMLYPEKLLTIIHDLGFKVRLRDDGKPCLVEPGAAPESLMTVLKLPTYRRALVAYVKRRAYAILRSGGAR